MITPIRFRDGTNGHIAVDRHRQSVLNDGASWWEEVALIDRSQAAALIRDLTHWLEGHREGHRSYTELPGVTVVMCECGMYIDGDTQVEMYDRWRAHAVGR